MIWQQTLDELRGYIAQLEADLAEVDAVLSTHAYALDPNPRSQWPRGSVLGKAIDRHTSRVVRERREEAMLREARIR